jgi:hypothetical protein
MLVGRWTAANATAEETERLARDTGQSELEAHALIWRGLIAAWRGEEERCREFVERARAITATHPMSLIDHAARWALGVLELGAGRAEAAFAQLEPITHPVVAQLASLDRIEAAARSGRPEAQRWLDELSAFAAASEAPWARGRVAHCRALLADVAEEADSMFREALVRQRVARRRTRAVSPVRAGCGPRDAGAGDQLFATARWRGAPPPCRWRAARIRTGTRPGACDSRPGLWVAVWVTADPWPASRGWRWVGAGGYRFVEAWTVKGAVMTWPLLSRNWPHNR